MTLFIFVKNKILTKYPQTDKCVKQKLRLLNIFKVLLDNARLAPIFRINIQRKKNCLEIYLNILF